VRVTLNGEAKELANGITVGDLIVALELTKRRIAVEINRELVPRDAFAERMLDEGDVIEIVHFIGGG